ncbi:MAG: 16S rRNA (uracil(1498)-N(3))-methyltransferase [bacterium]
MNSSRNSRPPRLFIPSDQLPDIAGNEAHYLRNVLRVKLGDQLELFDGTGIVYQAEIKTITKGSINCEIKTKQRSPNEPKIQITLAQALPKSSKMDLVVEKAVELGVDKIMPVLTERTISTRDKLIRWQKIAKEAAEQSGRAIVPAVTSLIKFDDLLKLRDQYDLALVAWEEEKTNKLKSLLTDSPTNGSTGPSTSSGQHRAESRCSPSQPSRALSRDKLLLLIGPEGGFSAGEVEKAKTAGFISISLGKRILRTETAGLAALSAILYELDW